MERDLDQDAPTHPVHILVCARGGGNRLRYVTQTEDAGYRLWSPGPDGVNNDGDGDDVLSS